MQVVRARPTRCSARPGSPGNLDGCPVLRSLVPTEVIPSASLPPSHRMIATPLVRSRSRRSGGTWSRHQTAYRSITTACRDEPSAAARTALVRPLADRVWSSVPPNLDRFTIYRTTYDLRSEQVRTV